VHSTARRPQPEVQVRLHPMLRSAAIFLGRWSRVLQSGAFVNHMWGDAGTALGTAQMALIRVLLIWPLKALAPTAYTYWGWQLVLRMRGEVVPARVPWPKGVRAFAKTALLWAGKEMLRFWLALEVLFYLYYRFKHWRLDHKVATAPLLHPGKPIESLRSALATVEMIQKGGRLAEPHLSLSRSFPLLPRVHGPGSPRAITPESSAHDLHALLKPQINESGIEQLLRDWNDARNLSGFAEISPTAITDSERAAFEHLVDEAEILALKQAEVCGWFVKMPGGSERWPTSRVQEMRIGNITEWVAWAFFNVDEDKVPSSRREETQELVQELIQWMEVSLEPGYNPKLKPMRLTIDPIPSQHRPLLYYVVTQAIFGQVIDMQFQGLGFAKHFSGTLQYWHRPGDASANGAALGTPMVFCHGIGVNLLPYRPFIDEMMRRMPDKTFFLISLPHISMRITDIVPSCGELVASLSDMLASWGFASAHFVGHSFGSLPLAWMARKAPQCVTSMTFIDPVCFLLVKPDVCYNFMYRQPADPCQLLMNYFISKELYIAHSLSRNFFWYQNQLWPDELPGPTLVVLGGRDSIVPAHSVRRYLTAYKHQHDMKSLRVLWFPDLGHGEINFGAVGEAACVRIVSEMLLLEAEYPRSSGAAAGPAARGNLDADGDDR